MRLIIIMKREMAFNCIFLIIFLVKLTCYTKGRLLRQKTIIMVVDCLGLIPIKIKAHHLTRILMDVKKVQVDNVIITKF